jgi:hypothetical protein
MKWRNKRKRQGSKPKKNSWSTAMGNYRILHIEVSYYI